jgi:hypothetical protein
LAEWFRDIALAEEELRREIAKYERENLTPLHFGPKIRCHPAMMITARNKMGSATRIRLNYSGYLLQTTSFRLDDRVWLEQNLAAGAALITSLGEPDANTGTAHQPTWHGVPWPTIEGFLRLYAVDPRSPFDVEAIRVYVQQRVRHGELVRWWVSLRGRPTYEPSLGTEAALAPRGVPVNLISRTRLKSVPKSIGSLISPATLGKKPGSGDEEVGLTDDVLREARDDARSSGDLPTALRSRRDKAEGLLLLYPISRFSKPSTARESRSRRDLFDDPSQEGCTVLGMSMVFPVTDDSAAVEYEVGSVGQPGDEYDGQE